MRNSDNIVRNCVIYSERCPHSMRFFDLMQNADFARSFVYSNIDPDPVTKRKKNEDLICLLRIVKVPTIYVNDQKFEGTECFQWFNAMQRSRQEQQMPQQQIPPQMHPGMRPQMPPPPNGSMRVQPQQTRNTGHQSSIGMTQTTSDFAPDFSPAMSSGGPDVDDHGDLEQFFQKASAPIGVIGQGFQEDVGLSSQGGSMDDIVERMKAERTMGSLSDTRMQMSMPR